MHALGACDDGQVRLVYVSPGPLDAKATDGLTQFAVTWPGEVVAVAPRSPELEPEPAPDLLPPGSPVRVVTASAAQTATVVRSLAPTVILALHRPEFAELTAIAPTVYTAEFTRRIRTDQQHISARSPLARVRISLGQLRREHQYRAMASAAAGLQCNGYAAWDAYSPRNLHSMRFRDHRIRADDLARAQLRDTWQGDRPLRVAFSGRLTAIKGPGTVLDVAERLPQVEFVLLGGGDQEQDLARRAPANVSLRGYLPFPEWTEYMRTQVDLALLPAPQGDPSCTYYEALGSGVPVLGLRNTTWNRLAEQEGLGWAESDAAGLAARIRTLRPSDLDGVRGRAFALMEPFEDVAAQRVAHLISIARRGERD